MDALRKLGREMKVERFGQFENNKEFKKLKKKKKNGVGLGLGLMGWIKKL